MPPALFVVATPFVCGNQPFSDTAPRVDIDPFPWRRNVSQGAIREVLASRDTLVIMPTGAGKSACYQVAAMASEGVCIVVSPLLALMQDQARV